MIGTWAVATSEVWLTHSMLTGEPRTGADGSSPTGAGRVLRLIREGQAVTRADLARRAGLARSTVAPAVGRALDGRPAAGQADRASPRVRGRRARFNGRPAADRARVQ